MVDFSLTEEQLALRQFARDFAEKEIRPVAARLDRIADPNAISAWDIYRKMHDLGFMGMMRPKAFGGLGLKMQDLCLVIEEFAAVDAGVATAFILLQGLGLVFLGYGNEEQRARWLPQIFGDRLFVLSIAFTESDRAGSDILSPSPDPKQGFRTHARLDGGHYVINGAKSAWVSNSGPEADAYLVVCRTDLDRPQSESLTMFYVPRDTPGLSIGKQTDKIGLRLTDHAEVYFDDVRVPVNNRIGAEGQAPAMVDAGLAVSTIGVGVVGVGLARAAVDYATDYAKQRKSWGQPLIEHQAIAMMLADMHIDVEAARSLAWHAAWGIDSRSKAPDVYRRCCMVKIHGSEMAVRVTEKAMNVLGAYGLSREYPVEKWHRDALAGPIEDIHNILWRLKIAKSL
ncbi:acyl-CoA dehydrogenase family protein [soil metagenome]